MEARAALLLLLNVWSWDQHQFNATIHNSFSAVKCLALLKQLKSNLRISTVGAVMLLHQLKQSIGLEPLGPGKWQSCLQLILNVSWKRHS